MRYDKSKPANEYGTTHQVKGAKQQTNVPTKHAMRLSRKNKDSLSLVKISESTSNLTSNISSSRQGGSNSRSRRNSKQPKSKDPKRHQEKIDDMAGKK